MKKVTFSSKNATVDIKDVRDNNLYGMRSNNGDKFVLSSNHGSIYVIGSCFVVDRYPKYTIRSFIEFFKKATFYELCGPTEAQQWLFDR